MESRASPISANRREWRSSMLRSDGRSRMYSVRSKHGSQRRLSEALHGKLAEASGRVSGITVLRRLLFPLRGHLRRIGRAGDATRSQLFALNIVFGLCRFGAVRRYLPDHGSLSSRVASNALTRAR